MALAMCKALFLDYLDRSSVNCALLIRLLAHQRWDLPLILYLHSTCPSHCHCEGVNEKESASFQRTLVSKGCLVSIHKDEDTCICGYIQNTFP